MTDQDLTGEAWRDLLSALLDGELDAETEARVRSEVAASPEAQEDLADLTRVRTLVRDLPAVEPPFGFYERMLRPAKRPSHIGAKLAGAVAAAAAAIVLIVGITPATDAIVPPVEAYAARHAEMDAASTDDPPPADPSTTTTISDPDMAAFEVVPESELDAMGTPAELTGEFRRMAGYQSPVGAVHLVYSDGAVMISVYEQVGDLSWEDLPDGTMMQVDDVTAWTSADDHDEVMVFERGAVVYTVIAESASDPHDEMVALAVELPEGSDPSMFDRFRTSCRSVAARFSMGVAEP